MPIITNENLDLDTRIDIALRQSKLFARALDPESLQEFSGETYSVDLAVPKFEWKMDGQVTSYGPCQLLGTWASDGTFLWGFENPSVSATAYSEIESDLRALPEISDILNQRSFKTTVENATQFCNWLAFKLNWLGCYPAHQDNGGIAFLAVNLTALPNHSVNSDDNLWCFLCGIYNSDAPKMIGIGAGLGLCSGCIEQMAEVANLSQPEEGIERVSITCCLCRSANPGVNYPHVSFCYTCVSRADGAINPK